MTKYEMCSIPATRVLDGIIVVENYTRCILSVLESALLSKLSLCKHTRNLTQSFFFLTFQNKQSPLHTFYFCFSLLAKSHAFSLTPAFCCYCSSFFSSWQKQTQRHGVSHSVGLSLCLHVINWCENHFQMSPGHLEAIRANTYNEVALQPHKCLFWLRI